MNRPDRSFLSLLLLAVVIILAALTCKLWLDPAGAGEPQTIYLPLVVRGAASDPFPPLEWDAELDFLHVTLERAEDCSEGCWRLFRAAAFDPETGGGRHHIYVKAWETSQLPGIEWHVGPGDPGDLVTKPAPDFADFAMFRGSCYALNEGENGPHLVHMGSDPMASDRVVGVGLPYCVHWSYELEWVWTEQAWGIGRGCHASNHHQTE